MPPDLPRRHSLLLTEYRCRSEQSAALATPLRLKLHPRDCGFHGISDRIRGTMITSMMTAAMPPRTSSPTVLMRASN